MVVKTSTSLWRSLEASGTSSGVRATWSKALGESLPSLWPFLRPSHELVHSYPCPFPGPDGCPREVVYHTNGETAAVCRSDFHLCERVVLAEGDRLVYVLDLDLLSRALRESLALEGPGADLGIPRTRLVGTFAPAAGAACPVYLCLPVGPEALELVVERLALRAAGPFVVIVSTDDVLSREVTSLLHAHDGHPLSLEDVTLAADGKPLVVAAERVRKALAPLRARLLRQARNVGAEAREGIVFFPTPPGAAWPEVVIRFRDSQTVSIVVRGVHAVLTYTQLGMAKQTSTLPTLQWELLRFFAEGRGVLDWKGAGASRRNQKRRERLSRDLRRFFRIEDDPIEASGNGWRCKFRLEPEGA